MRRLGSTVTTWDVAAALRAAALASGALILAWAITAATDEGGVSWGERAGRALPFAPVCAAVGAWLALAPGRARGEDRALAALGRSPWQRSAGAVVGGSAIAVACALAIAGAPAIDARGFFARVAEPTHWRFEAGTFVSDAAPMVAWRVSSAGEPARVETQGAPAAAAPAPFATVPPHGRLWAGLATALAGIALPMLAARARRRSAVRFALLAVMCAVLTALAFQASAVGRARPFVVALGPLLLVALAVWSYRSAPALRTQERRAAPEA
jgi:hypothetical protein